jgi:transcriptional regulator with XRE-family HTH domain
MTFEEILIQNRQRRRLSLREASALIGISHTYLAALEKGRDPRTGGHLIPSQDVLLKICRAYEIEYSKVISYFNVYNEHDIYIFMGNQLNALRKSNPKKFKEVIELIYAD